MNGLGALKMRYLPKTDVYRMPSQGGLFVFNTHSVRMNQDHRSPCSKRQRFDPLLNAGAVRERAHRMLAIGLEDKLPNFRIHLDRMTSAVDLVLEPTRKAYPSLEVPFHSRWRHFVMSGDDRWAALADNTAWSDRAARARAEFDLAIVSVFLDAGACPTWRYQDPKTELAIGRSEGLGLASLVIIAGCVYSANPRAPLRDDATVLAKLQVAV